jgi:hypothetical protein
LIAIVDDDASLREAIEGLLRSAGYRAVGFASAEAFLRLPDAIPAEWASAGRTVQWWRRIKPRGNCRGLRRGLSFNG